MFEVETRLIETDIPPRCDFDLIEIEGTDCLPLTGLFTAASGRYEGVVYERRRF